MEIKHAFIKSKQKHWMERNEKKNIQMLIKVLYPQYLQSCDTNRIFQRIHIVSV